MGAAEVLGVEVLERVRPVTFAREQTLPLAPALVELVPGGALRRGSTVSIEGAAATSLTLALAAGASQAGSWTAAVGLPSLGLAAAAELGVVLERLALVPALPSDQWSSVVAALVGSFDVLVVASPSRLTPTHTRRLAARLRERGSVLLVVDPMGDHVVQADVVLSTRGPTPGSAGWEGLGRGHGHLRSRRIVVDTGGRREASRPRSSSLSLPSPPPDPPASPEPSNRIGGAMAGEQPSLHRLGRIDGAGVVARVGAG